MTNSSQEPSLNRLQKVGFLLFAIILAGLILILRHGVTLKSPLDQLARQSLPPEIALLNTKPTIFEFYADWCEVCQEMAPAMISVEKLNRDKLDIVLLNVDNEKWQDLLLAYEVNGIPQLNFFDSEGQLQGKSIGFRSFDEIMDISNALIANKDLPIFNGLDNKTNSSTIRNNPKKNIVSPRSHG